jgi:hypothetical protein
MATFAQVLGGMDELAAVALVAVLATGCFGTETGNPPARAQLALLATSSDPDRVALGASAPGRTVVTAAWVSVDAVRLSRAEVCDIPGEREVDVSGARVVDLTGGAGSVVPFDADATYYCRLRVPLRRAREPLAEGAPPGLADAAVLVSGARRDGVPFTFVSRQERTLDLRSRDAPFALGDGTPGAPGAALALAFDVAAWLEGVDLDALEPEGGAVVIDDRSHRAALDRFEQNVTAALRLYRDRDGDGRLDDRELSGGALAEVVGP